MVLVHMSCIKERDKRSNERVDARGSCDENFFLQQLEKKELKVIS